MANTLNGINLAQIAQETLDQLLLEFLPIRAFATDFSSEVAMKGESVATRVPTAVAAQDLSSGYTTTDVASTAKTVTLNKFYGFVYGFKDHEVSKAGDLEWLRNIWIKPAVAAVLEQVMDDMLALVLNATFSQNVVIAAADFDADDMADLAEALSTLKILKSDRYALLKPTYIASLVKDNAIQSMSHYGDRTPILESRVPRVHGFDVLEYNDIPTNSENLAGFVAHKSALLIAARQVATPPQFHGEIENVADPVTGLPLQFRKWYDAEAGESKLSVGLLYGVAAGVAALKRIKSA